MSIQTAGRRYLVAVLDSIMKESNLGICDKASTVSYFYRNRWLTLTGSD